LDQHLLAFKILHHQSSLIEDLRHWSCKRMFSGCAKYAFLCTRAGLTIVKTSLDILQQIERFLQVFGTAFW